MGRRTIDDLLAVARLRYRSLEPREAHFALRGGAVLVDTRSPDQQERQGLVPGAKRYPLAVLEWHLDPASVYRDPEIDLETQVILICREGYSSTLAVARLLDLGFTRATDVVGGVAAWEEAGLPLEPASALHDLPGPLRAFGG